MTNKAFQFPEYTEWMRLVFPHMHHSEDDIDTSVGIQQEERFCKEKSVLSVNTAKTYALFYLLALRDFVNDGWEDNRKEEVKQAPWHILLQPLFNFQNEKKADQFLSHKSDHTSTIEQLNILYSINQ